MSKDLPVEIPVFVIVCVCLCICIFIDPAYRISYSESLWYLAVLVASVICFQKIYGLHGLNHHIIQYSEKKKVWMGSRKSQ